MDIFLSIGSNWKDPLRIPNFYETDTIEVVFAFFFRTTRTWEFNSTSPIRSMTFNMVLWGGPLYLLKLFDFVFNFITGWTIIGPYIGGFQLKFVSISRVINHMTCYNASALIDWWKFYFYKKNPLQDLLSSLNAVISTDESTRFITGHLAYT